MITMCHLRSFLGNRKNLKACWLVTAGIVALYIGAIQSHEYTGGINNSKATGLAAQTEPLGLWRQMRLVPSWDSTTNEADIATVAPRSEVMTYVSASRGSLPDVDKERRIVRTSSVDLVVKKPAETAEKIRLLAEGVGGFLVSYQISGGDYADRGSLAIRVPAERFEEARAQIRKLALRVEFENLDAQDVTRQYVDQAANLRNLRAEEVQYLSILKQAGTVKDTLEVTQKLSDVRSKIEQQQAEFESLAKQIETVSITISLGTEAEARVFGLNWRPLYQLKLALREGLQALGNYALAMTDFVFMLPAVLLWLVTIVVGAAIGWKLLRFIGRRAFGVKVGATLPQG